MRILGFDWDAINQAKLPSHDLEPADIECASSRSGSSLTDRFVLVVFEYDVKARWVRVVTAHESEHERWWKIYAKAKNLEP